MSFQRQAEQLLRHIKAGKPTKPLEVELASLNFDDLRRGVGLGKEKKAFWVNIYNAYYLLLRELGWERPLIFSMKLVPLAGRRFTLDEIEHGILRRCRAKWAAGFLPSPFYRPMIYRLSLKRSDCRIHFALNCGAKSCPPIAFYSSDNIDQQLDIATKSFLEQETEINRRNLTLYVSQLFLWYLGDFGGYGGLRRLLYSNLPLEPLAWKLRFRPYDWTERLYNFQQE